MYLTILIKFELNGNELYIHWILTEGIPQKCMASCFTIYSINQISDLIYQISYIIYKISDILYKISYINKMSSVN